MSKPGIYRGQCAVRQDGFMPIVVEVNPTDYDTWLGSAKAGPPAPLKLTSKNGRAKSWWPVATKVYYTACAACHQAEGQGLPPMFPGAQGSPIATGPRKTTCTASASANRAPPWRPSASKLSEVDIAAVVTCRRNAWGNNKGDMVAQDVLALKQAESK